jgi:DNA polymerase III sliding clamp (beta) subunit (PCNA family)
MEFKIKTLELQTIFNKLSNTIRVGDDNFSSMVMIEAQESILRFRATDGSTVLVIDADKDQMEILSEGNLLLRFKDIKNYVSKFVPLVDNYGTESFHFIHNAAESVVKCVTVFPSAKPSYRKLKLTTFNAEGYPASVKPFEGAQLILNSEILKRGIGRVLHCINPGEIRKSMTGVCVTITTDRIVFVGTNGMKLVEFMLPINAEIEKESYIISYSVASTLKAILDEDAQVFIKFEGRYMYVRSNNIYLIGTLILGETYPNYKAFLKGGKIIGLPRLDLYDSVKTVLDVLDPEDNSRLSLRFSGNTIELKSDKAEFVQTVDNTCTQDVDVDVNGLYFESLLKDFATESVDICHDVGTNYMVFRSPDDPDHSALLTVVKRR